MIKSLDYYVCHLKVLYEDNHIIAVEKPENVLSQKDITGDIDITDIVKEYLKRKYNKPGNVYLGLIHRLDRRVGGVMILCKTSKAASRLSENIRLLNGFDKYYLACVNGELKEDGIINVNIRKENKKAIISNDGKNSLLEYKYINGNVDRSYLEVKLYSGRYNQIRASFASINHPIFGDSKYGADKEDHIGLWCYKVIFSHPVTKEAIEVIDLPKNNLWKELCYKYN